MSKEVDSQKAFEFVKKTLDQLIEVTGGNTSISLLVCETIVASLLDTVTDNPSNIDANINIFAKNVRAHLMNLQAMESVSGKA